MYTNTAISYMVAIIASHKIQYVDVHPFEGDLTWLMDNESLIYPKYISQINSIGNCIMSIDIY